MLNESLYKIYKSAYELLLVFDQLKPSVSAPKGFMDMARTTHNEVKQALEKYYEDHKDHLPEKLSDDFYFYALQKADFITNEIRIEGTAIRSQDREYLPKYIKIIKDAMEHAEGAYQFRDGGPVGLGRKNAHLQQAYNGLTKTDKDVISKLGSLTHKAKELATEHEVNHKVFYEYIEYQREQDSKKKNEVKYLFGGSIAFHKEIDDSEFRLLKSMDELFDIYESRFFCYLYQLVYHPMFFKKYPKAQKIKVFFDNITDEEIYANGETDFAENVSFSDMTIGLHFDYYKQHKKEKYELTTTQNPEYSKEAVILHEMQHVCQWEDRGDVGFSYDRAVETLGESDGGKNSSGTEEANTGGDFNYRAYLIYKDQVQEQEAMYNVALWLQKKGLRYANTHYFRPNFLNALSSNSQSSSQEGIYGYGGQVNPWAACTVSIGNKVGTQKRSDWNASTTQKYERCVTHIKDQNRR